ncbi:MAG TPA: HAMP domain-containing sensor histidine kinase, partial [bacterium]|nr:HAMP domain-containing sensor histidine kinase [bacterium]
IVSVVDGFVDSLIEEARDAEKGLFAFFSEMLFAQNLAERVASLENELTLIEILCRRTIQFLKPDFVVAYTKSAEGRLLPAFRHPPEWEDRLTALDRVAEEDFDKGEELIRENTRIDGHFYTVVSIPLRSTSERFGLFMMGRREEKSFRPEEISLAVAGTAVVGFMLSNIKLHQQMLRDKQLVVIGQTIAGLSHDMRNILSNLEGGLNLLEVGHRENRPETFQLGYSVVKRSYQRLKELVLSMVDYSRQREPELKPTNLNSLVAEVAAGMKERFKEKQAKLKKELDDKLPVVLVDSVRMERAVANLLDNALDAVEKGKGKIYLGTRYDPEAKTVSVWVRDNGCGIKPEVQGRIFDLFYSTKGARGTGFGLAIVQKVAKEHGGTVEVRSEPGKGATFLVKLPARLLGK